MRASGEEIPGRPRDDQAGANDPSEPGTDAQAPETRQVRPAGQAGPPRTARKARSARARPEPPPQRRRWPLWPIPLALLGLAALVVAAILVWAVAPSRKQLPEDFTATRDITGTANALLSQSALESGDVGNALVTDVPITGQRTVRVVGTSGDAAQVQEDRVLAVDGQPIGSGSTTYAVDRLSLGPATSVPEDWNVAPHEGLTVAFPVDAQRRDYTIWVSDMQTAAPLRFVREESRDGVNTYVYEAEVPEAPIQDPAVLSTLPSSLSRSALQGMLPSLSIPDDQRAVLTQAMPGLPEEVPVRYTYQGGATYWVEPTTGTIVDFQQRVIRTGTVSGPGGSVLATLPVYNVDSRFDDASVAAAVRDANDRHDAFTAVGSTWPGILVTLGAVALIAALLGLLARRRAPRPPTVPPPSYRPTERTTRVDVDAARRAGQPQPPYAGQTPHTGPYRQAPAGQATGQPPPDESGRVPRRGPGRPPPGTPEP